MAFFLKKYSRNNKTHLSIYENVYSSKKKGTAHKSFKALGSLESLIANGIADPIAHFQNEVDAINQKKNELSSPQISELSPIGDLAKLAASDFACSLDDNLRRLGAHSELCKPQKL